jgi:hypothetical protein
MVQRYYFIEAIIILLTLGLTVTAIKYPKDVFVELPKEIFNTLFVRDVKSGVGLILIIVLLPIFLLGRFMGWHKSSKRKAK